GHSPRGQQRQGRLRRKRESDAAKKIQRGKSLTNEMTEIQYMETFKKVPNFPSELYPERSVSPIE
ncbi:hypothetical protein L9F63_005575, partial [Diploptera punctata]